MIDIKTVMKQLTGPALVNSLIEFMEQRFEDFSEIHKKYREVIQQVNTGEQLSVAIEAQIASDLLFFVALGINANLNHFRNPIGRTFLEVEPEIYLRESIAHSLPHYIEAQKNVDTEELNDDVIAHISYLESIGPKLAHYFGYLLGDKLLPRIVPGYQPDPILTIRYRDWICGDMGME